MSDEQTNNKIYSSFFRLYGKENLHISFNIYSDSFIEHLNKVEDAVQVLLDKGYTVDPKGAEERNKEFDIFGWVLGVTSKDQKCIHLYGHEKLEFKVTTVWEEDIPKLPIQLSGKLPSPVLQAPQRDVALRKKLFQKCNFRIALEPRRDYNGDIVRTDKGNIAYQFSHVIGSPKPVENSNKNEDEDFYEKKESKPKKPSFDFEGDLYGDILKTVSIPSKKMVVWARNQQKNHPDAAKDEDIEEFSEILDKLMEYPSSGSVLLAILFGKDAYTLDEISGSGVFLLTRWVCPVDGDGGDNPEFNKAYLDSLKEIWKSAKEFYELEDIEVEHE